MPKHEYETAVMSVVKFDEQDVVRASGFGDNDGDVSGGGWGGDEDLG